MNGIPGLVNIPVLGKYLFGNTLEGQAARRADDRPDSAYRADAGYHGPGFAGHRGGNRSDGEAELCGAQRGSSAPASGSGAPAPTAAAPPAPTPAPAARTPRSRRRRLPGHSGFHSSGIVQAQLSAPVVVSLQADNVTDLAGVPVKVTVGSEDSAVESDHTGRLLGQDGTVNPPSLDIRNDTGDATIEMSRRPGRAASTAPAH